jgi:hypothetical protein
LYNVQRSKQHKVDLETIIFLRGLLDESINVLNLMGSSENSQLTFEEFDDLCRIYSWSQDRSNRGSRDTLSKITKPATSGVTRDELGKFLENFKISLLGILSLQLDTLKFKKKQEDEKLALLFFVLNAERNTH